MEISKKDPSAQENWKLTTGWLVEVPYAPVEPSDSSFERLNRLAPGIIIPENREALIAMISAGIARSRAEEQALLT